MSSQTKQTFGELLEDIEKAISKYDEELKHTVNGKKEYVFKYEEFVGEGKFKFSLDAKELIKENRYSFSLFIKSLDIKFPNIVIVKQTLYLLHYRLKGNKWITQKL